MRGTMKTFKFVLLFALIPLFGFQENRKEKVLCEVIQQGLESWHVQPRSFDNRFSQISLKLYEENLDSSKSFLIEEDIQELKTFEYRLDDELRSGSLDAARKGNQLMERRIRQVKEFCREILATPFDFTVEEEIEIEADQRTYARSLDDLKKWWGKQLKYFALVRYMDYIRREKKKEGNGGNPKAMKPEEMEAKARQELSKSMDRFFRRVLEERPEEKQARFLNALIASFDPHSRYFPPRDKEDFDIEMSGTLEGIGVLLGEVDGYVKVMDVLPGGPAWIDQQIKVEDVLIKVAQESEEAVDVIGMSVSDVARLVRGKKGTKVNLTLRKPDGRTMEVELVRNIVEIQETYARSAVLVNSSLNTRIGYIYLPRFYKDFNHQDGRSCAEDVRKEIEKLKLQKVGGLILDLRGNGGGVLEESVKLAGLFVDKGPIVQVKDRRASSQVQSDSDAGTAFAGPMVVLVNATSASASEIVSAAIQDYGRGIIVGGDHTFGKGTVQMMLDLDRVLSGDILDLRPLGAITLTVQKYYRITGSSTQYRGVVPDITLPDSISYLEIGEKYLEHSLNWDTIPAVRFEKWPHSLNINAVKERSKKRVESNPRWQQLQKYFEHLKNRRDQNRISLNLVKYQREQELLWKRADELNRIQTRLADLQVLDADGKAIEENQKKEKEALERRNEWMTELGRDDMVDEAVRILHDMIQLSGTK